MCREKRERALLKKINNKKTLLCVDTSIKKNAKLWCASNFTVSFLGYLERCRSTTFRGILSNCDAILQKREQHCNYFFFFLIRRTLFNVNVMRQISTLLSRNRMLQREFANLSLRILSAIVAIARNNVTIVRYQPWRPRDSLLLSCSACARTYIHAVRNANLIRTVVEMFNWCSLHSY